MIVCDWCKKKINHELSYINLKDTTGRIQILLHPECYIELAILLENRESYRP
jgi:aspartyl-tRNA synthetase